jgi:hypothetical protein
MRVVVLFGLAFLATTQLKADLILYHATTSVSVPDLSDGPNVGHLASSASASNGDAQLSGSGSASASGNPGGRFTLVEEAHSSAQGANNFLAGVNSIADWKDVAFLGHPNTAVVGNTLRFTFHSHGFVTGPTVPNGGSGSLSAKANGSNGTDQVFQSGAVATVNGSPLDPSKSQFVAGGWDGISPVNGTLGPQYGAVFSFSGTFHLDVPIIPGKGYLGIPGAFYFEINEDANAVPGGFDTGGSSSAGDPTGLQLASVTLPDVGNVTPESLGVSLTFDSGIASPNLSAVPEPSSLMLSAIGGVVMTVAFCWRRRGQRGRV